MPTPRGYRKPSERRAGFKFRHGFADLLAGDRFIALLSACLPSIEADGEVGRCVRCDVEGLWMVFACPGCRARYRLDPSRIEAGVSRVRCGRCEAVFRVPEEDGRRPARMLVACGDSERAKQLAEALSRADGEVSVVGDGVEALLAAVRQPPTLAVLDEELGGLDAYSLCEVIKRTQSPGAVTVLMMVREEMPPRGGEWDVIPDHELVRDDALGTLPEILSDLGIAPCEQPKEELASHEQERPAPKASREDQLLDEKRAEAERLARIIVSDIVLYDPDRFDEAARRGCLHEALETELREGRALFERRIDAEVRSEKNHLDEELERVAEKRGNAGASDESGK